MTAILTICVLGVLFFSWVLIASERDMRSRRRPRQDRDRVTELGEYIRPSEFLKARVKLRLRERLHISGSHAIHIVDVEQRKSGS